MSRFHSASAALILVATLSHAGDANRLAYLDDVDPYYPSLNFPKLITPQWVGEDGVDAVVILAIDDMRGHEKWESYLRPILNRLKKIDGRAPVSIMTCSIDPKHPHLQQWLKEGLSIEVHTLDHPCPLLRGGDFKKAKATYDGCVDLMNKIPGNRPVAFRTPCCDSQNTVSPRFFAEIFNKTTPDGHFLQIDSSVFNVFTADDPALPRELVLDSDGRDRFRKYLPANRTFVNTIENYPYPYVIGRLCWEFPCMTPSDWQGQNLHKPNNPITLRDWKAALDCTVIKQGVFSAVFHPHGWMQAEQVVDFIDYAQTKYGKRVKFLTFKEALERLNKNLLSDSPLRGKDGNASKVKIGNGYQGYVNIIERVGNSDIWSVWDLTTKKWRKQKPEPEEGDIMKWFLIDSMQSARVVPLGPRDIRGFRSYAAIVVTKAAQFVMDVTERDSDIAATSKAPFSLPKGAKLRGQNHDFGLRLNDIDGDGVDDIIFSNEKEYGVYLFADMKTGWSRKVIAGKAGEPGALPPIAINGKNNGFFVHGKALCWQNEHTDLLPGLIHRIPFNELLKDIEPQAKSPEASLKCIQTRPGFRVELVAAEPLVQDPIAFAFGPDGKLWVVEMGDYPLGTDGKGKFGGRIRYLESSKNDGKYDKSTVFLDNLGFPTGVLPWRNGILVTCAPDIFFVEVKDGKPGKKEVLYTGFVQGNQQHRVNTLAWGLDNWIYVANGDSGGAITSTKTKKVVPIGGRDLRIRPDTGEIEAVTGQTQFGRSRDDWGNWFGGNNARPMVHFVLDDKYLARNPHYAATNVRHDVPSIPGIAPVFPLSRTLARFNDLHTANRITSACSPIIYRDVLFGEHFANNSFVCEPVHNLIHREVVAPNDSTFRSRRAPGEEQSEFLASSDNWFRPTMIQTGPDGCIWIADMYRAVIEHPEWIPKDWQKRLDLRAGHDKGRIYRIVPVDKKPREIPRLDKLDMAGLVAALDSPNGWQRDMAHMMLSWRNDPTAANPLMQLAINSKRPETRVHALCALAAIDSHILMAMTIKKAFHDPHPGVRRHAVRIWEGRMSTSSDVCDEMLKLVNDRDPQVLLQLAYTLGEWKDERAGAVLAVLFGKHHEDPFIATAVMSSVNKENLTELLRLVNLTGNPPRRLVENLLAIAAAMKHRRAVMTMLEMIHLPPADTRRFSARHFEMAANSLDVIEQVAADFKIDAIDKLRHLLAAARKLASDPNAVIEERLPAVRLLGRETDEAANDIEALISFLTPQTTVELQTTAIASLARIRSDVAGKSLLKQFRNLAPARQSQIVDLLLRDDHGAIVILDALESKLVGAHEIDATARQRLLNHKVAAFRSRAEKALAGDIDADRQKVLDAFKPALTLKGDATKGKAVFTKICAACHKLGGVGNEVGPDLAALAGKPAEYLLVAMLDPNRAVEARYVNYLVDTKTGQSFTGVLLSETSTSITIVGNDGKPQTILRTQLESLSSTGRSAMPEGLEKDLQPQDFADLLAHLKSAGPALKPKTFAGNRPQLVTPNPDGSITLSAVNAEIYGPTLVFEGQYHNLGYWSHADDHATWTMTVAKAGKYDVWIDFACPDGNAGGTLAIETGAEVFRTKVPSTGNWDTYRFVRIGSITLSEGEQRLTSRSDGPIRGGALVDLKSIKLIPVK